MASNALGAQGTTIAVGSAGSPDALVTIPEVINISGPDGQATLIDITNLSSTGKEYLIGLKDEGQVQLDISYVPDNAVHMVLRAAFSNRTLLPYRITFTDTVPATYWHFSAYVMGFSVSAGLDQALKATCTLKITGAITEGS